MYTQWATPVSSKRMSALEYTLKWWATVLLYHFAYNWPNWQPEGSTSTSAFITASGALRTVRVYETHFNAGHYKTWTLDWTTDWTLDSIMDSIIALDFWSSRVKGYSAAKLWCSWCCKLEGLIISTLQNYGSDNHFRWDSNLAQSLCFLETGWVLVDQNHTVQQQNGNMCWRLMQALERERMGFEPKTFWILVRHS